MLVSDGVGVDLNNLYDQQVLILVLVDVGLGHRVSAEELMTITVMS